MNKLKIVFYLLLSAYTLFCLYPIIFSLLSSLKSNEDIFTMPFSIPLSFHLQNYVTAWKLGHIGLYFRNTVVFTFGTLVLTAIISTMASFVLARFTFKLKGALLMLFVSGLMVPLQMTIVPLAYAFGKFHLNDNYLVMILLFSAFCVPMTVFILSGFMKSIPAELEEAAVIDGSTHWRIFLNVIVPLSMPALATASIFNFIQTWNNLLFPLMFLHKQSLSTISIGLLAFFGEWTIDYGAISAAAIITIAPPIIIYIMLQEKVEKGLMAGAIKG